MSEQLNPTALREDEEQTRVQDIELAQKMAEAGNHERSTAAIFRKAGEMAVDVYANTDSMPSDYRNKVNSVAVNPDSTIIEKKAAVLLDKEAQGQAFSGGVPLENAKKIITDMTHEVRVSENMANNQENEVASRQDEAAQMRKELGLK